MGRCQGSEAGHAASRAQGHIHHEVLKPVCLILLSDSRQIFFCLDFEMIKEDQKLIYDLDLY